VIESLNVGTPRLVQANGDRVLAAIWTLGATELGGFALESTVGFGDLFGVHAIKPEILAREAEAE
jgi:hypothetical protein